MFFENIFSFIVAYFLLASIPGPSICFTIASGLELGTFASIPSIIGQLTAKCFHIFLVLLGLNTLLEQSVELFIIVKTAGAVYIVYLGIKQWFAARPDLNAYMSKKSKSAFKSFTDGFIINIINPKSILFYAVLFPQFILPEYNLVLQHIVLGLLSIIVVGIILITYTILADKAKSWMSNSSYWRYQNRLTGSLMIGAGISLGLLKKR